MKWGKLCLTCSVLWYYWLTWGLNRQVWAVNSAGRTGSPWTNGRTGPAPPEGVSPPVFQRVSATSAVVDIQPPARPNGIVSLYRVFSLNHNNHTLVKLIIQNVIMFPVVFFCDHQKRTSSSHCALPVALRRYVPSADTLWFTAVHPVLGRSRGLHLLSGKNTSLLYIPQWWSWSSYFINTVVNE